MGTVRRSARFRDQPNRAARDQGRRPERRGAGLPSAAHAEPRAGARARVGALGGADEGRYARKRTVGEVVRVSAPILADGHDVVRAVVRWKAPGARRWSEAPMAHIDKHVDGDTWAGEFPVDALGRWCWTIEAWVDHFASWREELARKVAYGQDDLSGELSEGVVLLRAAAERAKGAARKAIEGALEVVGDESAAPEARQAAALDPELAVAAERHPDRSRPGSLPK